MADTQVSEACAVRYEGSTPSLRINICPHVRLGLRLRLGLAYRFKYLTQTASSHLQL